MIARGFKSVMWVAAVRVATERADLARVEREIVAAKRDIRSLQTELGTRGRLSQLEQWNADVLALSAPSSAQFVDNAFTLARLEQRGPTVEDRVADVHMASAAAAPAAPQPAAPVIRTVAPAPAPVQPGLVHRASFAAAPAAAAPSAPAKAQPKVQAAAARPVPTASRPEAKPKKEERAARIDPKLASEIGAAARAEKSDATGGN
jgi:hypothetical protein